MAKAFNFGDMMHFFCCFVLFVLSHLTNSESTSIKDCSEPLSCTFDINVTFLEGQSLNISGYKAASSVDGSITVQPSVSGCIICDGDSACASTSHITWIQDHLATLQCGGASACSNIPQITTSSQKESTCLGAFSCGASTLIDIDAKQSYLACSGDASCAYSDISGYVSVFGTGAFSLQNASIRSGVNQTSMEVYFNGAHAGSGTTVFCSEGTVCSIYCRGTGCIGASFMCDSVGGTNCIFDKDESYIAEQFEYDTRELLIEANLLCDDAKLQNLTFDVAADSSTTLGLWITVDASNDAAICCRGQRACQNAYIEVADATSDEHAVLVTAAQGAYSAQHIKNQGPVLCAGRHSCEEAHIFTKSTVYCLGEHSCLNTRIHGAQSIVCGGGLSCMSVRVYSNGSDVNVHALGAFGAYNMGLWCDKGDACFIHCGGYKACQIMSMVCERAADCSFECVPDESNGLLCPRIIVSTPRPTQVPTQLPTFKSTSANSRRFGIQACVCVIFLFLYF